MCPRVCVCALYKIFLPYGLFPLEDGFEITEVLMGLHAIFLTLEFQKNQGRKGMSKTEIHGECGKTFCGVHAQLPRH